ncbi:MAG: HAMP domain-containing protein, partial [Spirochaetota bacterium]
MTLKRIFAFSIAIAVVLGALLVFAAINLVSAESRLQDDIAYQRDAILLSETMTGSSKDLTNDIRQYAMTGDVSYRTSYFHTLDISNGKAARPNGTTISFKDLVKNMKLTSEENDYILKSNDFSMNLVNLETEVMTYVDTWIKDNPGLDLKTGGDLALQLQQVRLFDRGYMNEIDKIMAPVTQFQTLLMQRVAAQVKSAEATVQFMEVLFIVAMAVMMLAIILILTLLSRHITGSLGKSVAILDKMATGDLSDRLVIASKDEFGQMAASLSAVSDSVGLLVADTGMLVKTAVEGKLATRADASKHQGDYRKVVEGVNQTLDAVIGPLNTAANYVDRISKGDIPPKITDAYKGDFNEIKSNLNQAIDAINALVTDAGMLAENTEKGNLSIRADATRHQGDFRLVIKGVNDTLDYVIKPLNIAAACLERTSKGDIPPKITEDWKGDFNDLKRSLNQAIDAINALVADAGMLAENTEKGNLSIRADATRHQGDFRLVIKGVNDTLDYVIKPLNIAAACLERTSKGDIPPKITEDWKGDFNDLKRSLNQAIDAVNALVADAGMLSKAAVDGKLATRADATRHQGDFRKVVEGVNQTLDSVIGPLNVAANYVDRISKGDIPQKITDTYNGDFNEIKSNLNQAIDAVNALVTDAGMLAKAAVDGKLATRADVSKHQGDYRKIVDGVNKTLDAVIGPLNVAADYVDKISAGDIPPKITDSYNGDFNTIKN